MADAVGTFSRLGYASSSSGNATVELEFLPGSSLGLAENFIDAQGMSGTRAHHSERIRRGTRQVNGSLQFAPSAVELATLIGLVTGNANGTLAETVPAHTWHVWRDGTLYKYTDCKVDSATFSVSEGGPLTLTLNLIGVDETAPGGNFPSLTVDLTTGPFVMADAGNCSVGGTGYRFSAFELTINNFLEPKYRNSNTLTSLNATDREVSVSLPFDLGAGSAVYGTAVAGVAVDLTLTNGNTSIQFTMPAVQTPKQPLPFAQRGVLDLPWQGMARKSGTTAELTITLDSSP